MSELKATPGPWHWVGIDEIEQSGHPFTSIAEVTRVPRTTDPEQEQQRANIHLIASAPDLYEALKDARWAIVNMAAALTATGATGTLIDPLPTIDAALARARGEA